MGVGINAAGDMVRMRKDIDHATDHDMSGFDAAVFWGYVTSCQQVEAACRKAGIPWVFMDLAYWLRDTHYKVTINARHPDDYIMLYNMPHDRFNKTGVKVHPWKREGRGDAILMPGMSGKAAWSFGFADAEFEKQTITRIKELTTSKRPIIYRPKPSWGAATPLPGTIYDPASSKVPIANAIRKSHCVVTHHSNVGVDAVLMGWPVFTRRGAAIHMAMSDKDLPSRLEDPVFPDGREQWAANLAYCQWSLDEMRSGVCWRHIRKMFGLMGLTK